jgi:Protein of unknown function (DUF3102)
MDSGLDERAVGDNRLAALAADIRAAHAGVVAAEKTKATRALSAGLALTEAKSLVKHGEWLPWLRQHCGIPERTCQTYMKLAKLAGGPGGEEAAIAVVTAYGIEHAVALADDPERKGWEAALGGVVGQLPDPMTHYSEPVQVEWLLFILFLGDRDHVEWIIRDASIASPGSWLGEEGDAWRRRNGVEAPSVWFKQAWGEFLDEHRYMSREEVEAKVDAAQDADRPPFVMLAERAKRRSKSAGSADLAPAGKLY